MVKTYRKGYMAERELVHKLYGFGYAVMRAPRSGRINLPMPDIIAIKNPEIKSSEYVSQIHELLDNTNNRLNDKYGKKLIRFSCFNNQEEALHLGKYDNGDLALHLMTYPSYQQMILDWTPDINSNANMEEILKKSTILKGDLNSIDYLKTQERGKHANIYQKINDCDITNSNYEDKLCLKKMNELFRYIGKNIRLGKEYTNF